MTEEAPSEEPDSLQEVKGLFTPAYAEGIIHDSLTETLEKMVGIKQALDRIIPWLAGLWYDDQQRAYATREKFRLESEWRKAAEEFTNTLVIVEEMHYPVNVRIRP
jgi:hypothetical protein